MDNARAKPRLRRHSQWDFIPEGEGDLEEETAQVAQKMEQMWMTALELMETCWSFLQGIGAPEGITLKGPNPIPTGFDFWGAPYSDIGSITSIEQMVHRLWGTDNGGLPGVHSGGMLVLCQS